MATLGLSDQVELMLNLVEEIWETNTLKYHEIVRKFVPVVRVYYMKKLPFTSKDAKKTDK